MSKIINRSKYKGVGRPRNEDYILYNYKKEKPRRQIDWLDIALLTIPILFGLLLLNNAGLI